MPHQSKPYIYRNKGFISEREVTGFVTSIQSIGKKIKNRTHAAAEFGDWGRTYPLPSLPLGKSFVLSGILKVSDGQLPIRFLKNAKLEFFRRVVDEISPYANIRFDVALKHRTIALRRLEASLTFELGVAFVGFGYSYHPSDEGAPIAQADATQQIIGLAKLPLNLTIKGKSFILSHTEKTGKIFRPPTQFDEPPTIVKGSLPGLGLQEVVDKYLAFIEHPDFQAGDGSWSIGFPQINFPKPKDFLKLYETINKMGFPGKRAKCEILWHLKDYTCFKEMPFMAELKRDEVVQSLLEFEFDGGRQSQLDLLCKGKDKFKLYFSFDEVEDAEPLAELLKLKLERY